ncbi:hypothetical protein [Streptomyces sp. NPDC048349]|uniref:hypothetical protein n=1 Tax=Streptomyces sp. NPDC048349 TaxID=3155486 RepID=UPI00343BB053
MGGKRRRVVVLLRLVVLLQLVFLLRIVVFLRRWRGVRFQLTRGSWHRMDEGARRAGFRRAPSPSRPHHDAREARG